MISENYWMRYHLFKTSRTKYLLIGDSQAKKLNISNFNILSLPGAQVKHVCKFLPKKDIHDTIVLSIGGNDLFSGKAQSYISASELVPEISDLANLLLTRAKSVFVLGIPHRHYQPERTKEVNALLASRRESWKFRGISRQVYGDKHLRRDKLHLISDVLNGLIYILKGKILYKFYRPELEIQRHRQVIECSEVCKCLSWTEEDYDWLSKDSKTWSVVTLGKLVHSIYLADVKY